MPRLLLFTPCEKVITNQDDGVPSLISLLEAMNLAIPPGVEITGPSEQSLPFRWYVYALYHSEEGDMGKQFEQRIELNLNDQIYLQGIMPFQFQPDKPNMRIVMQVGGFPMMPAGEASLKLFLREAGEGNEWEEIANYPLIIRRPPVSE